tara:strand:- start:799 stop:1071 length:273 start_codon:yes stop_codon:yes gene_type:complete
MLEILLYIGLVSAGYIIGDVVGWLSVVKDSDKIDKKDYGTKSYSHLREKAIMNNLSSRKNLSYNYKAEPTSTTIYDAEVVGESIKINEVI